MCRYPLPAFGVLVFLAFVSPAKAAQFHCAAGNVLCLIDAINASNQNSEANTIYLEAGFTPSTPSTR